MKERKRVLFLCSGNSCRSQMAEGWLRHLAGARCEAHSAGSEAHGLNPEAVAVMAELGVDISRQRSKLLDEFLADPPEVVITVCERAARSCPTLSGSTRVLSWSFPDPARARGTPREVRAAFRAARDAIRERVERFLEEEAALEAGR